MYEVLTQDCDEDVVARISLEQLAFSCLEYKLANEADRENLTATELFYLSDDYKRECLDKMDKQQLADIVLTHPTVYLAKADKDTELLTMSTSFNALANLVFTRDQQLTTNNGEQRRAKRNECEASVFSLLFSLFFAATRIGYG